MRVHLCATLLMLLAMIQPSSHSAYKVWRLRIYHSKDLIILNEQLLNFSVSITAYFCNNTVTVVWK